MSVVFMESFAGLRTTLCGKRVWVSGMCVRWEVGGKRERREGRYLDVHVCVLDFNGRQVGEAAPILDAGDGCGYAVGVGVRP